MQGITRRDLDRLRIQINSSVRALSERSSPLLGLAKQLKASGQRPRPEATGIPGRECENELGSFLCQEHLFVSEGRHGNMPIGHLQAMKPEWVECISQGQIPAVDPARWAFVDTETTGLSGGTGTCAFLVGVGAISNKGFRVSLFFMRDYDEEPAMLAAVAACLDRHDVLLTYNGKAFDAPLLETRFRLNRQSNPLESLGHVDLLHGARRLWRDRMYNCKLGTLESEILGVEREGDIAGSLIPQRYFDFLRTGRGELLAPVFHHNVLDIVSLACLGSLVMSSLADPLKAPLRHGQDLHGLARWLATTQNETAALQLYRRAMQAGLPSEGLCRCLWESAQLERRAGNHPAKVDLLGDLVRASRVYRVDALEALAKHYEHLEGDFAKALDLTRAAQRYSPSEELGHRERRLLRRIASKRESRRKKSAAGIQP